MFKSLIFLWRYAWKVNRGYLFCLILFQITNSITPILIMVFPKFLLDELMGNNNFKNLMVIVLFFSVGIFISQMLSELLKNSAFYRRCIILESFQVDLNTHLSKVDFDRLENPNFLNLKQNAEKFLYANGQGFSFVLDRAMNIIGKVIVFATIIGVIASLNPIVLIAFLMLSFINSYFQMRFKKTYAKLEMDKNPKEREVAYYNGIFSNVDFGKELRVNGGINLFIGHLKDCLHNLWIFYKQQMHVLNKSKLTLYLSELFQRGISYSYMVYMISIGKITFANFTLYINAISTFTAAMNDVIDSINDISQYSYYFQSVEEFLNLPSKISEGTDNITIPQKITEIEFRNVGFKYEGRNEWALRNVSCILYPNENISIVGENGAGKSTFIKLLCRLYEPTEGMILLNGIDIRKFSLKQYSNLISSVFQDYQLFSVSVGENISLSSTYNETKISKILESLKIDKFINTLPKSIKNRVHKDFDESGFEPSGGIGQKLAIGRATYKNSPIVILDEPTASLDPRAEYEIFNIFSELTKNKLALFISHRLSISKSCDRILVFKNGEIIENGTHENLMSAHSVYYELYSMQSQYYIEKSA